jgi:5S rRNA maturation endonuclease (ribonuclease M5)
MVTTTTQYRSRQKTQQDSMEDNPYIDKSRLDKLSDLVSDRLDELLDKLGVEYQSNYKFLYGPCPVHGGDNYTAFNIFKNGNSSKSNWTCYTHQCQRPVTQGGYGNTVFGLVRGVLSQQGGGKASWKKAVDYVCDFLGVEIGNIQVDEAEVMRKRVNNQFEILNKVALVPEMKFNREMVRKGLKYPCEYYLKRGFSESILDRYDVGFCDNPSKMFYNRCVFPIYDENCVDIIGFTARTIFDKCESCKCYHDKAKKCPATNDEKRDAGKWKNSKGFEAHKFLFNYWFAKPDIEKTGYAILVEGPGDCMKLEELGIKNSLGILGAFLSEPQLIWLENVSATTLIVMTDNDEAGRKAAEQIKLACGRLYRLYFPKFSGKDAGDLNKNAVTSDIEPILNTIRSQKAI